MHSKQETEATIPLSMQRIHSCRIDADAEQGNHQAVMASKTTKTQTQRHGAGVGLPRRRNIWQIKIPDAQHNISTAQNVLNATQAA